MNAASHRSAHLFTLTADAAPGLLPRVLNPFAKRDVIPHAMEALRCGDTCRVTIECRDLDPVDARLIRGDLMRMVGLHDLQMVAPEAERLAA